MSHGQELIKSCIQQHPTFEGGVKQVDLTVLAFKLLTSIPLPVA